SQPQPPALASVATRRARRERQRFPSWSACPSVRRCWSACFIVDLPEAKKRRYRPPHGVREMEALVDSMDSDDLRAVLRGDDVSCATFLRLVSHPADIVEALRELEAEEWPRILRLLDDAETRAEVVAMLEEGETEELVEHLPPAELGPLLRGMDSDD